MALNQKPVQFRIGFVLYFMGFIFLFTSVTAPDLWMYEKESIDSDKHHGRSLWNLDFQICTKLKRDANIWWCEIKADKNKLAAAAFCLFSGVVVQFAACLVLLLNERNNRYLVGQYFTESLAGLAAHASVTGILIWVSMTHLADNVIYGAGLALNVTGILCAYTGLLLTGLYTQRTQRSYSATSDPGVPK